MLTIRLSRIGKKNKPMYRLIISEKARDPYSRSLEILGSYNPFTKKLQAKADRIKYWLSQGAGMSATVNNLLVSKGIIEGKKRKASRMKKKKNENAENKAEDKEEKNENATEGENKETEKKEVTEEAKSKEK